MYADCNKILYLEMRIWVGEAINHSSTQPPTTKLWTIHEIFDADSRLVVGKFRLPLYADEQPRQKLFFDNLEYFSNMTINMRVCQPNDPDLDIDGAEYLIQDYTVPGLHLKNIKEMFYKLQEEQLSRYQQQQQELAELQA